jgi:hypothetical protein
MLGKGLKFSEIKKEQNKSLSEVLREKWLNLMKGKESVKDFEEIDFNKILPDLRYCLEKNLNLNQQIGGKQSPF